MKLFGKIIQIVAVGFMCYHLWVGHDLRAIVWGVLYLMNEYQGD